MYLGTSDPPANPHVVKLAPGGAAKYEELNKKLPELLTKLLRCDGPPPSKPGVYVIVDGTIPQYVGNTRNLRDRIAQHGNPGSTKKGQANFAARLAEERLSDSPCTDHSDRFQEEFKKAKADVKKMKFLFVEEADPELRTVFEVYATCLLGTEKFNKFETH